MRKPFQDTLAVWAAINIVSKRHREAGLDRSARKISLNFLNHPIEQIRSAMNIADRVNSLILGVFGCHHLGSNTICRPYGYQNLPRSEKKHSSPGSIR